MQHSDPVGAETEICWHRFHGPYYQANSTISLNTAVSLLKLS